MTYVLFVCADPEPDTDEPGIDVRVAENGAVGRRREGAHAGGPATAMAGSVPGGQRRGSGSLGPGPLTVDPVDADVENDTVRCGPHGVLLPRAHIELGEPIHDGERSTLGDPVDPALDDRVGPQSLTLVLLGLDGEHDAGVATDVPELALLQVEERGHDDLVAIGAGPGQCHVRRTVRVDGGHVHERTRLQQLA